MRIGILTLPLHTNYGGILQAYAMQTVLERMGHEAYVIEEEQKPLRLPVWRMPSKYVRRVIRNITGHPYPIFYEQKFNRERPVIRQYTDIFIDKHVKRRFYASYSDIKETDFDVIIVGSDQVWRPRQFANVRTAFLDFTEGWDIGRMAYAASFGTDAWEYTHGQTKDCSRLLKRFDAVSVREDSGAELCLRHFGVKAEHVLDPTMLLGRDDYTRLFVGQDIPHREGGLLCYILDRTSGTDFIINNVAEQYGLTPFSVNSRVEDINAPLAERVQPPVEQWLAGYCDAEFVVTDSFHACVFSIIFNKPFYAVANAGRGLSRFRSLLSMFGLEERLLDGSNFYGGIEALQKGIDWNSVNKKLAAQIDCSVKFVSRIDSL